jgi:hypothetical protein
VAEGFDTQQVKLEKSFKNGGHFENWNFCSGRNKVVSNLVFQNYNAKYILCCAYVIVTQWFSIFKNFNKCQQIFLIFLAKTFANYFVPYISCRYGSGPLLFEVLPAHWPFMPSLLTDLFIATCS